MLHLSCLVTPLKMFKFIETYILRVNKRGSTVMLFCTAYPFNLVRLIGSFGTISWMSYCCKELDECLVKMDIHFEYIRFNNDVSHL